MVAISMARRWQRCGPGRLLLLDSQTHLFYKAPGEWVLDSGGASEFESKTEAKRFCQRHGLHAVQLVVASDDAGFEVLFPVL